eukprot:scaffold45985_cov30-Tisochrysis_lutea.AAC.1
MSRDGGLGVWRLSESACFAAGPRKPPKVAFGPLECHATSAPFFFRGASADIFILVHHSSRY